jgi:Protein of unknown function C-terminus (DUF2399)
VLLRQLGAAGARLRYHGDFDWPGITIANGIAARFGALPWRLDAGAFRSAADEGGPALRGTPVTATWDPALTQAMLELGVKVEEERVLDDLLADLAEPHPGQHCSERWACSVPSLSAALPSALGVARSVRRRGVGESVHGARRYSRRARISRPDPQLQVIPPPWSR